MMSFYLSGGVEVLGFISPTEPTDEYPVIDPLYGIDGFRNVDTLSELNSIPNLRRRAGMVVGVSGGTQYYKLNPQPWNGTITDWDTFSLGGGTFTGGTVTGDTIFTQGVTATTFSASTYLGLPLDVYTTGLTFNPSTYDISIERNDGVTLTQNLGILATDVTITGGTYDPLNGSITFVNNTGGTFTVSGFITGFTDVQVTGYTYQDNTFTISDSSGNTFSATIDVMTGLTINGDLIVTGTTSLQGFSATTISATTIGTSGDCVDDIYVSNIHSCSPLNINPLDEGNVYFGSTSGVTIDLTNNRLGIGTSTPVAPLEIYSNQPNVAIPNRIKFSQAGGNIQFEAYEATISDSFGITLSTNFNQRPVRVAGSSGLYVGGATGVPTPAGSILVEGNIGIGTTTPNSRLQVDGQTTLVQPQGSDYIVFSSSTLANSGQTMYIRQTAANTYAFGTNVLSTFMLVGPANVVNFAGQRIQTTGAAILSTIRLGDPNILTLNGIPSGVTAGTQDFRGMLVNPTVNFGGTYSGNFIGYLHNPTITSMANGRHIAMQIVSGDVLLNTTSGNVGIGTTTPSEKLDVSGKTKTISLQVTSGATTGYVLTSDASGNATWQIPSVTADTYTTGFTYNNNTFTISDNSGSTYNATINTVTGLTVNGGLTVTGTSNLNGTITSSNLSGSTDRLVQVNSGGTFSATQEIISAYITSGGTAANQLENVSNWDINGNYTGSTIIGTYQGQKHYDGNYFYEAVQDNIFIRLIRG